MRPRDPVEPPQRFETPPGHQGQVDFGTFRLPRGRRHALVVVLGYSRLLWLQFYERQTLAVLTRGLETAFGYFGGVPTELLFDQMKAVVVSDRRGQGGRLAENPEFVRFAAHWGFRVRACRPHRPQTKGKVERPIRYVRQSFHYGRAFLNDADLNRQAQTWLEQVANVRMHGTTRQRPRERFEREERERLRPLASRPYSPVAARTTPDERPRLPPPAGLPVVARRPLSEYARLGERRP